MDVRPSPLAGLWYPSRPQALSDLIDGFLRDAQSENDAGRAEVAVIGLMAPHAGYQFSGAVAAKAFAAVCGAQYDLVVVLCPSHFHSDAPIITSQHAAYGTPLGEVPVAREAAQQLAAALAADSTGRIWEHVVAGQPRLAAIGHDREHAIEIELPFLQRALKPGFQLLPLMVRDQSQVLASALGRALATVIRGRRALLVASSDLSHYRSHAVARAMDDVMLAAIEAGQPAGLFAAQADGRGQACGLAGIAAVLWAAAAAGPARVRVVGRATSADANGAQDEVVGYGAAVIYRSSGGGI